MTIREALILGIKNLRKSKIDSPMLDADVLLALATKKSKEYLYTHPEAKLTSAQDKLFQKLIARRAKNEPVAYITGHKEFFGLDFIVNRDVLIPRPETELIVEEVLRILKTDPLSPPYPVLARIASPKGEKLKNPPQSPFFEGESHFSPFEKWSTRRESGEGFILIDIGTGSGCIPIAIAKNSGVNAIAIDASSAALKIAKKNAEKHQVLDSRLPTGQAGLRHSTMSSSTAMSSHSGSRTTPPNGSWPNGGNDKKGKIKFIKNNLLKNYKLAAKSYQLIIITANLPYLPTSEWRSAMPDVKKYEPRLALVGGRDGLNYYRELLPQIKSIAQITRISIVCLFEFCPEQKQALKKLVLNCFPTAKVETKKDLAGRDRLLEILIGY